MIDIKLIDRLKNKYGSDEAIASAIGVSARTVWNWRHGKGLKKRERHINWVLEAALKDPCPDTSSAVPPAIP